MASSFSLVLEAAAAKAWSRRTLASCARSRPVALARLPSTDTTDEPVDGTPSSSSAFGDPETHVKRRTPLRVRVRKAAANPASRKARTSEPLGFCPVPEPGRVADTPAETETPSESSPVPAMPVSPQSLYRDLLFIMSNPPSSVRAAIDYYFDWPKALHSTKSFNLLISLALRNASFAQVSHLFSAMRAESVPENMETRKLHVRWLVRTGKWNEAWQRVLEVTGDQDGAMKFPSNPIPLPLWLELFGSQKRGALRHWVIVDRKPTAQAGLAAHESPTSEATPRAGCNASPDASVGDTGNAVSLSRKRLTPQPWRRSCAVELSRYRALMQASPLLASSDQVEILPRTILVVTRTMYHVGQRNLALSTALSYVKSLPPRLRRCDRRRVLDLVNSHLSMATRHRKPGLKQHFTQRRILGQFLLARPNLVPSPTTLFLLLAPLRGCRRSGTLAMQFLRLFEKRWGPRVQSGLVRRRIASLALKEGRLDIVVAMMNLERYYRASEDASPRTVYASRRRPWRTMFSRRGTENRRWRLIEDKYRRQSMLKR